MLEYKWIYKCIYLKFKWHLGATYFLKLKSTCPSSINNPAKEKKLSRVLAKKGPLANFVKWKNEVILRISHRFTPTMFLITCCVRLILFFSYFHCNEAELSGPKRISGGLLCTFSTDKGWKEEEEKHFISAPC